MTKSKRPSDLYSISDLSEMMGANICSTVKRYRKLGLLINWNVTGKRGIQISKAEFIAAKDKYKNRNK